MTTQTNPLVNQNPKLVWFGHSGQSYEFDHFAMNGVIWNEIGGVYIFCRLGQDGRWYAVYIGETDNFRRRLADEFAAHHRRDAIAGAGATHVCALVVTGLNAAQRRLDIEADLRHKQNPPCNRQ